MADDNQGDQQQVNDSRKRAVDFAGAASIYRPGVGWVDTQDIGRLPVSYDPKRAQQYNERGLPPTGSSETNVFGERGAVVQGTLSPEEQQFWSANPLGAVMDRETGALVGLGNNEGARQQALQKAGFSTDRQTGRPLLTFLDTEQQQRAPSIDDFIDPAIEARRGEIANERAAVMGHLNTASTQRTGGGRHGGGGPSQWETEYAKLKALDHADSVLQKEQFGRAHLKAQIAGEQFKQQRQMDTANQTQGFYSAMANVRSPIGTPEHAQEVLAIAGQFPLAVNTPEIKKVLQEHADLHDSHAQLIANAQAQGKIVTQTGISASGKPTYKVTDPNVVPTSVEQRYNRLQASIQQHLQQSEIEKQNNIKAKRADFPYSKAPELNANLMEADAIAAKYPTLMPKQSATNQPQTLDVEGARAILNEVGGDKEKARALARQRGYQF